MADATGGAPPAPLLDLETAFARHAITIDDVRYELVSADELPVLTTHRLGIKGRRIDILQISEDPADSAELGRLVDEVAREVVIDLPDAVFAKLGGTQKWAIVEVFSGLLLRKKLGVAGAIATATGLPQIGERLSPVSSASTAAAPAGGWLKRLLRSFAHIW